MTARKLLIVSPAFPPHPSPATHRARFLARYARQFGWDAEVVAVDPAYIAERPDWELARLVPTDVPVHLTPAIPHRFTRRLGLGDLGLRAYYPMRRALRKLVERSRPDLIYLPGGPFPTFGLGADLAREFGIPYVLDFTDPWVYELSGDERRKTGKLFWAMQLWKLLEPRAVRGASRILAVSDGTTQGIRDRYPDVPGERFSSVPFGFEPSDAEAVREMHDLPLPWDPADGMLHVAYIGVMPPRGYETLRAIFSAVLALRKSDPDRFLKLRLHFVGTSYDPAAVAGPVMPVAREMGVGDIVTESPLRIPYLHALRALGAADLLLAIGSTDAHYTASKIFPCILARRPVLAVFHQDSSVCEIMRTSGAGALVTYDDSERAGQRVEAIADAMRTLLSSPWDAGRVSAEAIEEFSAERMTAHVARVLDEALLDARYA